MGAFAGCSHEVHFKIELQAKTHHGANQNIAPSCNHASTFEFSSLIVELFCGGVNARSE